MNLVRSNYNVLFAYKGKKLLFNLETKAFLTLTPELYDILSSTQTIAEGMIAPETLAYLQKIRALVEEETAGDYFYQQKFKYQMDAYSQNVLSLTILPTLNCNCACFYCFEKHKTKAMMTDEVIDNLVTFINQHVNAKTLNICWYGGEPLLGFNVIKKIWNRIGEQVHLALKDHQIITNGYLINDEVIDFFKKHPLTSVQITLDGRKEVHDARRILKHSGKGTFDVIYQNIRRIAEEWQDTKINVRVNIDKSNKDDFSILREEIKAWRYDNIRIYPGIIRTEYGVTEQNHCDDLTTKDIQDFYTALNDNAGITHLKLPVGRLCVMTRMNSYLIGPEGEIYKCWNDVGEADKIVGNIKEEKMSNLPLFAKYMTAGSLFDDGNCKDCRLLPICSGGCPRRRVNNRFGGEHHDLCTLFKDQKTLLRVLCKYYDYLHDKADLKISAPVAKKVG